MEAASKSARMFSPTTSLRAMGSCTSNVWLDIYTVEIVAVCPGQKKDSLTVQFNPTEFYD